MRLTFVLFFASTFSFNTASEVQVEGISPGPGLASVVSLPENRFLATAIIVKTDANLLTDTKSYIFRNL